MSPRLHILYMFRCLPLHSRYHIHSNMPAVVVELVSVRLIVSMLFSVWQAHFHLG